MRAVLALALLGLGVAVLPPPGPAVAAGGGNVDLSGAVAAPWTVQPGVEIAYVSGAAAGAPLTLVNPVTGERLLTLLADSHGQANFAYVPDTYLVHDTGSSQVLPTNQGTVLKPGDYRIVDESTAPMQASPTFHVMSVDENPPQSFYDGVTLDPGYHYVKMRDGTEISMMIRFPLPGVWGPPPYPTLIEYSGYSPANPATPDYTSMIAGQLGFATVGVNMRGTGCSGGVFDIFTPAQAADGYDVIEYLARQPWVKNGKPGMAGLSYPGISQLIVAATQPPHLASISPQSVIEDPWYQQWPGGIYNSGFTKEWLAERDRTSAPGGTSWVKQLIDNGDTQCAANQIPHYQNPDFQAFGKALDTRPKDADERRMGDLAKKINVPVFLTGGWQDEQTGSRFGTMLDSFTSAPVKKFTMYNGRHPDGFTPKLLSRWWEFQDFYVSKKIPNIPPAVRLFAPQSFQQYFDYTTNFDPNRFTKFQSYDAARAAYEAEPVVRVLFEFGAGDPAFPAAPVPRFEKSFSQWPPAEAQPWDLFLGSNGALADSAEPDLGGDRFAFDPTAGPDSYASASGADFIKRIIPVDWLPMEQGKGVSYVTPALTADRVIAGNGFADLWVRTDGTDADVQVLITEIRPDGQETLIQTGLERVGFRTLDPSHSSAWDKDHYFDAAHLQPIPAGQFVNVQVPLFPVAHVVRAGSRLRVEVHTPGHDFPLWEFENPTFGGTYVDVAHGGALASKLVLPTIPASSVRIAPGLPPCQSLRGQPCRTYVPVENDALAANQLPATTTTTSTTTTSTTSTVPDTTTTTAAPSTTSSAPATPAPVAPAPVVVVKPVYTG